MPYSNVPENKWEAMDRCVEKVMADGKTKESAIAICYASIVERQIMDEIEKEPEAVLPMDGDEESAPAEIETVKDEPVGLAAELGAEIPPEESDAMEQDIEGEPEQEIAEGVEGPPEDDVSSVVKVEFIDDGDDFEMDAAIAGVSGESPYPDMRGQEPPSYEPPSKPPDDGETPIDGIEGETAKGGGWTPPNISIQELMDMEPASMFYNNSVKDVVASEREMRSAKDRANRQQRIADLRPRPELDKEETAIERVFGVFRRLIFRHHGPGPHPGTGTPQAVHAGGRGGGVAAADAGVAARPEHVGASIKLQKMANPRTTSHMNDSDPNAWEEIRDTRNEWGTDKETGAMMDSGSWSIASQVTDNVQDAMGRGDYEEATGPDEYVVQNFVDDLINSDTENDHYEVESALKNLYEETEKEALGSNPTWETISEFIKKSEDEMEGMSDSDIENAVTRQVSLDVIDVLEKWEKGEKDTGIEDWVVNFALEQDSAESLREDIDDYGGDVVDYLQNQAYDVISDHHQQNPMGYDYDYLVDEFGVEPESLGVTEGSGDDYGGEDIGSGDRTYFYSTDNETGEIVAVMQTTRAYEDISQSRIEDAARRFGFDADEVSSEMLVIDLLASKYPRNGYGTEMILQALEQAHEEDRGLSGSAVMAAAMFYDKLGAQYLSEMGQTQGGSAFWTNVQVHAAYEWLQSQMSAIESGEISKEAIGTEQAQAEARGDEPPASQKRPSTPEWQGSTPETLRELDGTRWTNPGAGGADVAVTYDDNRAEWSAIDLNDEGAVLYTYDAEDASHFFERLANEGLTVPEVASTPSPQHIAVAINDGLLSVHVDEGPPTPALQTLRDIVGTEWLTEEGGSATIEYQSDYDSWVLNDAEGHEIFNNDAVDADMFFSRLYREGYTPSDPAIPSASHLGTALTSGELSVDIDRPIEAGVGGVEPAVAPETLRPIAGTTWSQAGGTEVTIDHDPVNHVWFANRGEGSNAQTILEDEDASAFFSQLNRQGFIPTNPYVANAQAIGSAIMAGTLSTDIDEATPTSAEIIGGTAGRGATPTPLTNLADFAGTMQADYLGIQNPAAANATFVSFVHEDSEIPVVAIEVNPDRIGGDRIWEVVGSGQLYGSQTGLLTSARVNGWIATAYGVVGSDVFGGYLERIAGEDDAQRFSYNMLRQSSEANRRLREEEPISLEASSVARSAMRRVERHYGPGPHPGTGTSQDVHGKGGGGKTRVGVTSAVEGKPSGQVFEEMRSFKSELNKITSIKNVSVTPGVGGWEGERESTWVVSYEGNGKAMRLIARTAKMHGQDAVIFAREGGEEPISSFAFSDRVTPNERDEVENLLVEAKVGWTWLRLPGGKPTLMIMNVPQYGGEAEAHRKTMSKLAHMFDAIEMPHDFNEVIKKVDLLEKEGPYGYDTILEAGN